MANPLPQAALQIIVEEEEKAELWMIKGLKDTVGPRDTIRGT
jgi:hypothetical protein